MAQRLLAGVGRQPAHKLRKTRNPGGLRLPQQMRQQPSQKAVACAHGVHHLQRMGLFGKTLRAVAVQQPGAFRAQGQREQVGLRVGGCLLYTSPSPRDS